MTSPRIIARDSGPSIYFLTSSRSMISCSVYESLHYFSASTTRSGHVNKMVHSFARKSKNGHFYFNRMPRLQWTSHFLCPCFKRSHNPTTPLFNCMTRLLDFQVDPQSALLPSPHPHTLFISCSHLQVWYCIIIILLLLLLLLYYYTEEWKGMGWTAIRGMGWICNNY